MSGAPPRPRASRVQAQTHGASDKPRTENTAQARLDEYNTVDRLTDAVLAGYGKWREIVSNVLRKREPGRKRASAFGWECSMRDISPTFANGCLQRSGYRDVDVFVRNVARQRDEYGIDSYGATVKYEIRTDTGRKVWSHEERIHWNQRRRKTPSLVQFESEYGSGSIADMAVAALGDDACAEMEEAAMSAEHNGSRRPARVEADRRMTSDGRRAARVRTPKRHTSHLRSSTERIAMGNMKADDIVIERLKTYWPVSSHGHIYIQDFPELSFDVSERRSGKFHISVWLSDPNSVYDSESYSIWCEYGEFDYDDIYEKLGIDWDDPDFEQATQSIDGEDLVKAIVSLFLDETSIPYDIEEKYYDLLNEDEYDASRSNARRRSTRGRMARRAPRATRRNASRRKSAWNDGFSFNGDSAWMVWYNDFAIDCDADRMPDGTWRVVYTLMDPLDTDGATGLSRLGTFNVDLSEYEYEEDALRDFMEDNIPPVPQADQDRYSLRDIVGYIMNEYGRIGTIETREDVADAYMRAYGSLPSDSELDEIVDCINDNYFVHISSRRTAKASSCRRPNGRQARGRSARNRSVRRASAPNRKKSMRKGAGFHSIPREFGGGWIETDEVEPGRWRARGSQGGEYATRAVYGRTEQEAVRKAVKEMQGYPEARDLTVDDVMGKASGRTPSRRSASARRQAAKRRANSSLPPDDRKSSEVYAVDKTVNYILSNKDRLNGKRDSVVYDNVFDFVYNDLLSDKSLVNDLGFAFGSENPYNLAGYITQEAIDYSADTYGLTVESKRNLHRTANRKKMPVKSPRARRIASYGRKNRSGRR